MAGYEQCGTTPQRYHHRRPTTRTCWAARQVMFGDVGDALKVLVTRVTEVSCAEAEEDSHRAAVTALVLQEISAVLGAHLHNNDVMTHL